MSECPKHYIKGPQGLYYNPCCYCDDLKECTRTEGVQQRQWDKEEQASDDAMYEYYHDSGPQTEDDWIIEAECSRNGIPKP